MKEYNRIKDKVETEFEKQTLIGQTLAEIHKYFNEMEREENIDLKSNIAKLLTLLKVDKSN